MRARGEIFAKPLAAVQLTQAKLADRTVELGKGMLLAAPCTSWAPRRWSVTSPYAASNRRRRYVATPPTPAAVRRWTINDSVVPDRAWIPAAVTAQYLARARDESGEDCARLWPSAPTSSMARFGRTVNRSGADAIDIPSDKTAGQGLFARMNAVVGKGSRSRSVASVPSR